MINGNTITDPSKVTSNFSNHFSNIANNIANKIPKSNHNYREYLKETIENSFVLHQTTNEEIENLKNNKAFGPNNIPTVILKYFRKTISIPLSKLVNLSFNQGKFPSILKIAKVLSIFKKTDKVDADNYRPISLLSNLSKIIEKLMHKRL